MIEKLKQLYLAGSIVVMPDFFVDRIIRLESKEKLFGAIDEKARAGRRIALYLFFVKITPGSHRAG